MTDEYFNKKMEEEREYIHNHFYSTKSILLNVFTLGFYGLAQYAKYLRRVGLY